MLVTTPSSDADPDATRDAQAEGARMTATANGAPHVRAATQMPAAIAPDDAAANHSTTHNPATATDCPTPTNAYRL
ncbi:MAG TPA: hypothetical protein VE842_10015 [Pyrinomonadaceae bacterium]|nr:hypothetical protein [Pyrinomonadaceae bacterium]